METVAAIAQLVNLASTLTTIAIQVQQVGSIIQKAQAEGRTTLTDAEWAQVKATESAASQALAQAILNAQTTAKPA